ncbi:hypothetical protein Nepgr_023117 [Nepenthes gracilis]|uniref:Uncharacterized protein n=1 Tax=Nepenthes gracilis TaxID=150966 RepID=A0AAD3T0P3_NEPGR|nr:hypothetical protein Nepgr_023117 [Nepenthes gracilis]
MVLMLMQAVLDVFPALGQVSEFDAHSVTTSGVGGSAACEVAELLASGNFILNVVVVGITISVGCNVYVH